MLRPILGIGAGAVGDISKSARRIHLRNEELKSQKKLAEKKGE